MRNAANVMFSADVARQAIVDVQECFRLFPGT
jgi:hypothetical protein